MYYNILLKGLLSTLILFSILKAEVPSSPGPYIGASSIEGMSNSARLSFRDNAHNENGFYLSLYDYEKDKLYKTLKTDATNNDYGYVNIHNLNCDKTYKANVIAYNSEGNSSSSDFVFFNLKSTFNIDCPTREKPHAPGDYIGITDINETAVRINFLDNSDNEDGFIVYGEGIYLNIPKNNENKHASQYATLKKLTCNKNYNIQVVAYNNEGNSTASNLRKFNIKNTFDIACNNIPPFVKLKIRYYTLKDIYDDDLKLYDVSAEANDTDGRIVSCKWEGVGAVDGCDGVKGLSDNWALGRDYPHYEIRLTVTDNNGATATDSIPSVEKIAREDASDSISISASGRTLKVGQTLLLNAYVNNLIPRNSCGTSVNGHSWSADVGIFNSSMYETGHFICYGYRASTSYWATEEGNVTLTLFANGGKKSIPIQVFEKNNTIDNINKTVFDNISGLMWQDINNNYVEKPFITMESARLGYYRDYSGDTAQTYCDELEWGGYDNWRIPSFFELTGYVPRDHEREFTSLPEEEIDSANSVLSSKLILRDLTSYLSVVCVRR